MRTIEVINTQEVRVEYRGTIEISEEDFLRLQNGEISNSELFDMCGNTQQTDMWFDDGENIFDYEEI
mgnify:CR=1 FL=1|jgi:hypothetical protein